MSLSFVGLLRYIFCFDVVADALPVLPLVWWKRPVYCTVQLVCLAGMSVSLVTDDVMELFIHFISLLYMCQCRHAVCLSVCLSVHPSVYQCFSLLVCEAADKLSTRFVSSVVQLLRAMPPLGRCLPIQRYFRAICDYPGKADLKKCY